MKKRIVSYLGPYLLKLLTYWR